MKQKIMDRYLRVLADRANLSSRQEAIVEVAFDLALTDMEDACMAAQLAATSTSSQLVADVHALKTRIQEQDSELLRLTTLEDRLTQWLSGQAIMLDQFGGDLVAAIVATSGDAVLLGKLHELQNSVAYLTDERNRLKRQMADLENTIEAVRDVEHLRPLPASITKVIDVGTLTIHSDELVRHNGNGAAVPVVEKPRRIDYTGTNEELRQAVYAAMRLFYAANGRAPSHNDWKMIGPGANLPSVNTIENRLGVRWTEIAKGVGLEPNASFNKRSEGKADNAEATFRPED